MVEEEEGVRGALLINFCEFGPCFDDRPFSLCDSFVTDLVLLLLAQGCGGKDDRRSVNAANSNIITKRRVVAWAMERGMSCGFDATMVTGVRGAIPLDVSFEPASSAFFVFVLCPRLVRRVPVVASRVWPLKGVVPMFEFTKSILVGVLEVGESLGEILSEFPVANDGNWSRRDSLRWYSRTCSRCHWGVLSKRGLSIVFLFDGRLVVLLES